MDQPTHVIDPEGEVIIIVRNANLPFAELDEDMITDMLYEVPSEPNDDVQKHPEEIETPQIYTFASRRGKKKRMKRPTAADASPISHDTSLDLVSGPAEGEEAIAEPTSEHVEEPTETGFAGGPSNSDCLDSCGRLIEGISDHNFAQQDNREETLKEKSFRIQVSAKHLVLASPVFKQILTGGWKESVTYLQKGSVEITTEGWDIEALLILLRVMHCQNHHVPRTLTLEMFAKVAVIADYYGCKETIGFFADTWIGSLEVPPETYCRDLILWLWISYYMKLPDQFQKASSIAISQSNGWINNCGLPIPDKVLGKANIPLDIDYPLTMLEKIDSNRQQAINNIIILLQEKREALLSGSEGCGFECSSIMYGALTKQMQSNGLLSPVPVAPFLNLNYEGLVWKLRSFKSPQWCGPYSKYHSSYRHECSHSTFESLFRASPGRVGGLDLHDL
ncbi:hypothetical protein DTO164E3_1708 [Paecilomyces variotii]|nr:hypothetical protein DTO164E3_1708 [Paecilomyces variotii]KAJ9207019.1 hypothetical protein DTO032I3_1607 [Paecilomyces variotii]KAJ9275740.1 hypothetical protein DTO021D3_7377 [Paecilomyces variotii]KAJ9340960.1 hypothetical protein DTO027B6_6518 [Paecilomyces variotii]KAJ9356377.1 hypothetical protein DTO027B9_3589 [Paecilomyces variotii]